MRRAGIEPWAWIINNSITATSTVSKLLRQRAHNELPHMDDIATHHAKRHAVVPLLHDEPVGVDRLLELAAVHSRDPEEPPTIDRMALRSRLRDPGGQRSR